MEHAKKMPQLSSVFFWGVFFSIPCEQKDCIVLFGCFFFPVHLEQLRGGDVYFNKVVVVSNLVICSPLPGEMIQFDKHIFQMGGSTTN